MTTPVVDVHAHLAVPAAEALVASAIGMAEEIAAERAGHSAQSLEVNRAQLARVVPLMADLDRRLADMDAMGVDVQAVGPMPMHHYWTDEALAADFTRATNEGIAAFCAKAPERLAGLGTAPLQLLKERRLNPQRTPHGATLGMPLDVPVHEDHVQPCRQPLHHRPFSGAQ